MDGYLGLTSENSLGKILGCKVAFCSLFPYRKVDGYGGKDFGEDGGHEEVSCCSVPLRLRYHQRYGLAYFPLTVHV